MKNLFLMWCKLLLIMASTLPFSALAGPMGFKDSWMSMGDFSPNWREAFVNYAVTPRDAWGMSQTYMRSDDKNLTRDLTEVTYTRLLHRWNAKNSQANLWFIGGLGVVQAHDETLDQGLHQGHGFSETRAIASPGVQFDYETTRVYFATTARLYRAQGTAQKINHDYGSVRAGFSFYEAEYEQTQPWFIVEARRMHALSDKTEITPMLRLINKNYFVEAGVNNSRQARFNFMYIF